MKFILKSLVIITLFTFSITAQHIIQVPPTTDHGNRYYGVTKEIRTYNNHTEDSYLSGDGSDNVSQIRLGMSSNIGSVDNIYITDHYEMSWVEYILPKGLHCSQAKLSVKLLNASSATQECIYAFEVVHLNNSIFTVDNIYKWNMIDGAVSLRLKNNCEILTFDVTDLVNSSSLTGKILFGVRASDHEYPLEAADYIDLTYEGTIEAVDIIVKNDMNGYDGGQINFGLNSIATEQQSPINQNNRYNVNDILSIGAIENQTYNNYNYIWNDTEAPLKKSEWQKEKNNISDPPFSNSQSTTYIAGDDDDEANITGYLRKECNLTFTNSFNGISTTGSIKVNGSIVSAPTAQYQVIDQNLIQVEAVSQTYNDIQYNFSHWSDNNSTTNPRTITANSHANYTAVFVGTPIFTNYAENNRNLTANSYNPRTPNLITLNWNEHISTNVTKYKIYRSDKSLGETYFIYLTTVNRGTTSYVDDDYFVSNSISGVGIKYDVRAYYNPDLTESDGGYIAVYGDLNQVNKSIGSDSLAFEMPVINEFALNSNYPNPFNPTTQISYQIPADGFVNLIVYNMLGQEVAQLVNQNQSMGKYSVNFNASNLPSGVYIYKLHVSTGSTTSFSDVKKMLLTK